MKLTWPTQEKKTKLFGFTVHDENSESDFDYENSLNDLTEEEAEVVYERIMLGDQEDDEDF